MLLRTCLAITAAIALGLANPGAASAGRLDCDEGACAISVSVNGEQVGGGELSIDENGNISLSDNIALSGDGWAASVDSASGHTDPFLIFGVGGTNNSNVPITFAFGFSIPIGLAEPLVADASVSYSLTDGAGDGATLFPAGGTGKVVDSQDIRVSPFLTTDKGVDVGDACSVSGAGAHNCGPYNAGPVVFGVPGGPTYDIMSVVVSFGLTPHDAAGVSGRVSQVLVPEPGTLLLLGSGLAGLLAFARRR